MTDLPAGWRMLTPHEIAGESRQALVIGPFGSNLKTVDYRSEGIPLVFVRDIRGGDFSKPRTFVSPEKAEELKAYHATPGDVLITKMGAPPGDAAVYSGAGPAVITADCIRLRPALGFDARYVAHAMHSPDVRAQISVITSGVAHQKVSLDRFRHKVRIPIPPLLEQKRILRVLEGYLSRLDAGVGYLDACSRRARALAKSVLFDLVPDVKDYPSHWESSTVGEAGLVELGRQRRPDWHSGPNMRPYLRVANVFEDRIDISSLMEMHWPEETFERFRLHPGDVLLNEGQSPEWLGRPAIYRGIPEKVAFTNSLLRFKAREGVLPEFALLVFRRHMHAGRFARESRITTNIAHLSATRLKKIEFPVPPLEEQLRIIETADTKLTAVKQLEAEIAVARRKATSLRRSLLAAAFSGRLTGAASDVEQVEEIAADIVEAWAPEGLLV
ncbi:restriction endonuclease subunit S [Streptomyces sp. LaBMicrA B280]|uniref:restriction endonuclease subunit S n=1 Tax=Streptomyces sp. LaBMicrA B280 TaxID=3391001 RepID=UPI003BA65C51